MAENQRKVKNKVTIELHNDNLPSCDPGCVSVVMFLYIYKYGIHLFC